MSNIGRKFVSIFIAEIEDLEEDLGVLMGVIESRHRNQTLTGYVYWENTSVLRQELMGLKYLVDALKETGMEDYPDLDSLHKGLSLMIANKVKEYQFPEAVHALAERKLAKVRDYLKEGECD